jgi:hypothetical protein
MNFDDISTDTVTTSTESLHQLAGLVSNGNTIDCSELRIDTSEGMIRVFPEATNLRIQKVEDE